MGEKKHNDFVDKHIVSCPHCGKDVLDHMTGCPFCKNKLTPAGYAPLDPAKMKKIKLLAWIILGSVTLIIAIFIIASRY